MHPEANLADVFYMLGDFEKFENYTDTVFKHSKQLCIISTWLGFKNAK